ncbi:MAG: hypothetical protein M1298_05080 [Chloroflexi bacterium]|nr:hypothetical protein [Chloroflexota bacterium]
MLSQDSPATLCPLNLTQLLTRTLELYRKYFWNLLGIVLGIQLLISLVSIMMARNGIASNNLVRTLFVDALGLFLIVVLTFFMEGAVTVGVAEDLINRPIDIGRAYSAAGARLAPLTLTGLLAGFLIALCFVTIILIPLGIYLAIRWLFLGPVVMIEGLSGSAALQRSSYLVRGRWWPIFGTVLLTLLAGSIASALVSAILGFVFRGVILGFLIQWIITALVTTYNITIVVLLYMDARARKETVTVDQLTVQW